MAPVQSSAIVNLDYRDDSRELLVTFVTGKTYVYYGVPAEVFAEFVRAASKGRFFNQAVRNRYFFRQLVADPQHRRAG
jgi:hypothetical protein